MRRHLVFLIPMLIFAGLAGVFLRALQSDDVGELPSALIGTEIRPFNIPVLTAHSSLATENAALSDLDLKQGEISVVNFWASWCGPCKIEHPQLMALAMREDMQLIGINYKDDLDDARAFLDQLGDPFYRIGVDDGGRVGIDWGLTGVPETFVVDGDGRIVMKHVGPLTRSDVEKELLPALSRSAL